MDLENVLAALEIRKLHRNAAVETAGSCQCRIEGFRPVGRGEDDDTGVALKAIHLRQQLVQRLLALIVSADITRTSLLADGVDLIDKDNARCLFLGLLEQVTHLRRAHADEHFHKLRTAHGKERHIRLAGDGLGKHGLAGSGRAYKQHALWHLCADLLVF